jgi:hypothetical protein
MTPYRDRQRADEYSPDKAPAPKAKPKNGRRRRRNNNPSSSPAPPTTQTDISTTPSTGSTATS